MGFKTKTYTDDYLGRDFTEWICDVCGWQTNVPAGADVCCCPVCEGRYNEGESNNECPCDACPNQYDENSKCGDKPEICVIWSAWYNKKPPKDDTPGLVTVIDGKRIDGPRSDY